MRTQSRTVEQRIAGLASRAHGVVSRRELLDAGLSRDQVGRRVRRGALIVEFPGVYRVGHRARGVAARYLAAVKACGAEAVLSGLAAAHLLGLLRRPPSLPEVTTLTERRIDGIRTTRTRKYRATPRQVEAALRHRPNTPGARKLRKILHGETHVSLSA